ncbi:multidrug resistance domain protein [Bordetella holmesii 70147]|nr:multidrug resistance domain protein [Bordetella holmesii 70147]
MSRPKVVMAINLTAIAFKALFNWLLIYGKFGLPALGAAGRAWPPPWCRG